MLPRSQASKARQALESHYKSSRLYAIKFRTTCFLIIMSVQPAGDRELKQVGRLYCDICLEAANQVQSQLISNRRTVVITLACQVKNHLGAGFSDA